MDPKRIQKLSDPLANQIAAGEVVERAGSAMKELVENSLDAGAKSIRIKWNSSGVTLLEVADDGHGIHAEDLRLALDRHATSKIASTDDLFAIRTWGFRGEALASIGAVSRLTLSSRHFGAQMGREILCEGGFLREEKDVARPVGTTVRVEDLFFNTPARKKFLKSPSAETTYCLQNFHRLALGSPGTSFEFESDGEVLFRYAATSTKERIADVFRSAWKLSIEPNDIKEVNAESSPLKMTAWLLPSKYHIPSTRGILLYVNNRSVKDKLLQQAVLTAAKETLFGNLYPQLVLMLDLPPESVDVNVHPTKAEVRFRESGHVFAFIRKYLERALSQERPEGIFAGSIPAIEAPSSAGFIAEAQPLFSSGPSFHQKASGFFYGTNAGAQETSSAAGNSSSQESISAQSSGSNLLAYNLPGSNGLVETSPSPMGPSFTDPSAAYPSSSYPSATHAFAANSSSNTPQFLGTLKNTYLVCQDAEGLILVDQHAAHERVTFEKLKAQRFSQQEGAPLLIPIQIELGREQLDRLENELPKFAELGLIMDRTGPTILAVREVPSLLLKKDGSPVLSIGNFLRKIVQGWEETIEGELAELFREKLLDVLASESCHGSVRAGQSLSAPEAIALLRQMRETDFAGHCPHGRPTTVRFRWSDIERLFKRIQ